ncbi:MAG: transposase [Desulfovibrio sp.]|nr:transposase [Desulfovibrio sp.]
MAKRPRYSSEFKAEVRLREEGRHLREVPDRLLLSSKTLEHWLQAAREGKVVPAKRADENGGALRNRRTSLFCKANEPKKCLTHIPF